MTAPDPALSVRDLVVSYGPRTVVNRLSFHAEFGAVTAVLGPNGAGKTTTLECAEGLRTPDSGTITVLGESPGSSRARAQTGVMLQDGGLPMARTTGDVLALAAALRGQHGPGPTREMLARFDLTDVANTPVRRLSGGQRQRLAFAVAIIGNPRLVFLDEPSAGLDPRARTRVWDVVRSLRSGGCAVVLTTHLLAEAEALADVVHVVSEGRLRATGSPRQLIAEHAGTDSLHVTLRRALEVAELADLASVLAPSRVVAEGEDLTISEVPEPGTGTTTQLASWCERQDAPILTLRAGGGTLEHAYLALTGDRELEEVVA